MMTSSSREIPTRDPGNEDFAEAGMERGQVTRVAEWETVPPIMSNAMRPAGQIGAATAWGESEAPPVMEAVPIALETFAVAGEGVEREVGAERTVGLEGAESASGGGGGRKRTWLNFPLRAFYFLFQLTSLILLLAVASSIPILQLAGLGYMLEVGRRIADRGHRGSILPGLDRACRIGVIAAGAYLTWLPVWLVSDYAYSASLIDLTSPVAGAWRVAAWIVSVGWVLHVAWAMLRGGRWYHFVWPAPVRFVKEIWRPTMWRRAEDALWNYTVGLQIPRLTWLGLRGAVGALAWLVVPGLLIMVGLSADEQPGRVLLGLLGALLMTWVLLYLPFLQIHMARENRLRAIFDVRTIRADFKRAPWAFFLSFFVTLAMALPLYLFRIESVPQELLWIPCLFFVALTLPARMLVGWALRRGHREIPPRHWANRWAAWTLQLVSVPFYVMALYLALITSWDGLLILFVQHSFLVPVPFAGT